MPVSLSKLSRPLVGALIFVALAFSLASPALAAAPKAECENGGGEWSGPNSSNGTCTYSQKTDIAQNKCPKDAIYREKYKSAALTSSGCLFTTDGKPGNGPITLGLGGPNRVVVTFSAWTCSNPCVISASLPRGAKNSLPANTLATVYVRLVSGDGEYLLCFNNKKSETLSIYRYFHPDWRRILTSSSNPICSYVSGNGPFFLGN